MSNSFEQERLGHVQVSQARAWHSLTYKWVGIFVVHFRVCVCVCVCDVHMNVG